MSSECRKTLEIRGGRGWSKGPVRENGVEAEARQRERRAQLPGWAGRGRRRGWNPGDWTGLGAGRVVGRAGCHLGQTGGTDSWDFLPGPSSLG
jgi:hypothetical protein